MELRQYILMGLVLLAGSSIQSAAGFAFGMFAVSMLLVIGFESYEAIALVGVCAMVQSATGAWKMRGEPDWRPLLLLLVLAVGMQPVGAWLHRLSHDAGPAAVHQVFGGVLLSVLAAQWLLRPTPRDRVAGGWAVLAMLCAGLMSGLAGMGGPPIVLWIMAHNWSSRRIRATLWVSFIVLAPLNLVFQWLQFGDGVWRAAGVGLLCSPIVWLGMWPGMWLGDRLSQANIRRVSFALLFLIAVYLLVKPVVTG